MRQEKGKVIVAYGEKSFTVSFPQRTKKKRGRREIIREETKKVQHSLDESQKVWYNPPVMKRNLGKIKYTFLHKLAFLKIEKQLLGKNTLRGYLHDIDKLIMYCFLPTDKVHAIHVKHSRHHDKCKTHDDYVEMVIDWECARYTKADKPLNAAETLKAFYPHMKDEIAPVLEELGLIDEKWYLDDAGQCEAMTHQELSPTLQAKPRNFQH